MVMYGEQETIEITYKCSLLVLLIPFIISVYFTLSRDEKKYVASPFCLWLSCPTECSISIHFTANNRIPFFIYSFSDKTWYSYR